MLANLPKEIIYEITDFMKINTTINFCKTGLSSLTKDEMYKLLNNKIGIDVSNYTLSKINLIISTDYIIFLLNTLGTIYNGRFGFNRKDPLDNAGYSFAIHYELLVDFIREYKVENCDKSLHLNYIMVKNISKLYVNFQTVILRYPENSGGTAKEWYNSKRVLKRELEFKDDLLPPLNSRSYITVDKPFVQVTISAQTKGSNIIIDDLLFASRALTVIPFSSIASPNYFNLLTQNDKLLILELRYVYSQ